MLLSNKLFIPRVSPSIIHRKALIDHLNKGLDYKLTTITAQAGYGKTTALSDWAQICNAKVVWLSLDKYDNDFSTFWSYVLTGIELINPEFAVNLWPLLLNFSANAIPVFITPLLHELQALTEDWVFIFDDFHMVELDLINESLLQLLDYLPRHVHLYLSSRSEPSFPTTKLFLEKELHRINVENLRFQLADSIQLFNARTDLNLSETEVIQLVNRTEGWVSALQLAALAMESTHDQAGFIQHFNGKHKDMASYLMEEVFQIQSAATRDFLLKTSILSQMNSSLCQAVTQSSDGQEMLEKLVQLNLLTLPLDEDHVWYRYHSLFSDFLQHTLQQKHPQQWLEAHIQAAQWLEANEFKETAIEHFLTAKQYTEAIRLIELLLPHTHHSKWNTLHRWLTALPEDAILGKPMIDIYYIGALIGVGEWEMALTRVREAEPRILALKDFLTTEEWSPLAGTLYFFGAVTSFGQKEFNRANQYFEMFDTLMPEGNPFQMIGANSYGGTDHDDVLAWINDLNKAEAFLKLRIKAWGNKTNYPAVGYFLTSYSELLYEWNRLDEAKELAVKVVERSDIQPFARIMIASVTILAKIEQAQGKTKNAIKCLEQLKLQMDSPDQAAFIMKIDAQVVRITLQQDPDYHVNHWLENSGYHYTDPISSFPFLDYLILAKALANKGETTEALELLERMNQFASNEDRLRNRIKVRLTQSVIFYHLGNSQDAFVHLIEALQLAAPHGYIRSFLDEGPTLLAMLYLLLNTPNLIPKEASADCLPYIKQLLNANQGSLPSLPANKSLLSDQELRVLRGIEQSLSNQQIADQIFVTIETVKTHVKRIYKKLKANNRVQAVQNAQNQDIL